MRTTRWQTAVVAAIAGAAGVQAVLVTIAALPPQVASDDLRGPTEVLSPYFAQDWRLFAPNPIGADRSLEVQATYRAADGTTTTSDWFDVTDAELDLVRRHVLGGRAGYGSLKLVLGLDSWWTSLTTEARRGLEELGGPESPADGDDVQRVLVDEDTPPAVAAGYRDYDESAVILASDTLRSFEPDLELLSVRYRIGAQAVVPWRLRDSGERPARQERTSGWFVPAERDADRSDRIASFMGGHR